MTERFCPKKMVMYNGDNFAIRAKDFLFETVC